MQHWDERTNFVKYEYNSADSILPIYDLWNSLSAIKKGSLGKICVVFEWSTSIIKIDIAQTFSLIMQAFAVAKNVSDMLIWMGN